MKNHIRVEETSVLYHGLPRFSKNNFLKGLPSKIARRDNNPMKTQKRLIRKHLSYPEMCNTSLNSILTEVLMAI